MPNLVARLKSREGGIEADGHRSYIVVYQVESDELNVQPDVIEDAVNAAYYSPYPTDPAALLKKKRVSQEGSELFFHNVTLEYDTRSNPADKGTVQPGQPGTAPNQAGQNAGQTAPNLRPWVLKWDYVTSERQLEQDLHGNAVLNSANQRFDPPLTIPVCRPTLSITAWRLVAQQEKILRFMNKVNTRPFLGAAKAHARCTRYAISSVFEQGAFYWQVDVTVEFNEIPWNPVKVLDAGTVEYIGIGEGGVKRFRTIVDGLGNPMMHPLNGSGLKMTPAQILAGQFSYLEFRVYGEADFSQLI